MSGGLFNPQSNVMKYLLKGQGLLGRRQEFIKQLSVTRPRPKTRRSQNKGHFEMFESKFTGLLHSSLDFPPVKHCWRVMKPGLASRHSDSC